MAPPTTSQIRRFYEKWTEEQIHREWTGLWRKQLKIRISGDTFLSLNKLRNRISFPSLRTFCTEYAPRNVYMSALNWLMPERVGEKTKSRGAHPIGGEYVVDIDSYLCYKPHSHRTTDEGVCLGCLSNSKDLTERLLDKIAENYREIKVVFSGKSGYHVHVLDFEVRDWANINEHDPLKSHEVARFLYTKHLNESVGGFDTHHFTLSSDVLRVITFPESLNGETGLICSYLGSAADFGKLEVDEILEDARRARGVLQGVNFMSLDKIRPARLEPHKDGVVILTQKLWGGAEARR